MTPPHLSTRANDMPPSPIRKLVPFADEAKKKGVKIYHLNIGQPDIPTPPEFMDAVRNYKEEVLAYGNSKGSQKYLSGLVEYYKRKGILVEEKDIQVTTGGSEAIIFAMISVADAGDEIIVFEPFYTNYNGFAQMANVKLMPITLRAENGFRLSPQEEIEDKITSRTRAILICSPNNPTGTVYTREEMEMIADIAKKHDLFVLSDEVYREFIYEGKHTSIMHMEGIADRAILLDSVSKRYSACGARIGCMVSKNQQVIDAALRMGQARLCSPSIEQFGAASALKIEDDYFETMAAEYKKRRDTVYDELMKIPGAVCLKPNGAFYIMAKLPVKDIEDFTKWMLTDFSLDGESTMIAPGPGFYATPGKGKDEARIAYVLNVDDLKKAMRILAKGIETYNKR
ncbi:MAG: aminotransferase class I/II-fold pyridoxal phosphate-dependent enzyme [candidate division Zixibacteria bacterium]|nr:aminotransferase class I/II-fold pyridoxal phosphate-dependent enzyme [candidate division Zixibacteria bacterium]